MNWTPGPWRWDEGAQSYLVAGNEVLCAISPYELLEPDARLIASAPEMAELLSDAFRYWRSGEGEESEDFGDKWEERARTLLARIQGDT